MRSTQRLIGVHTIFLCALLVSIKASAQQISDSLKTYSIKEVAVVQPKTDALQLLQKLVAEKQRQFRDTQIAYILTREDALRNQTDTMPDIFVVRFAEGDANESALLPFFNKSRDGYRGWKFAVFSLFGYYDLLEKSSEDHRIASSPECVVASLQASAKSFYVYGKHKLKDSLISFYEFKDTGTAQLISYYDRRNYAESPTIRFYYLPPSVLPFRIVYTKREAPDVHYVFQQTAINLEGKTLLPFNRYQPIEALIKQ